MEILNRRKIISQVLKLWEQTYSGYHNEHVFPNGHTVQQNIEALKALDLDTCSREDIDNIMGNQSWTDNHCCECKEDIETTVFLGETDKFCLICITKAAEALETSIKGEDK